MNTVCTINYGNLYIQSTSLQNISASQLYKTGHNTNYSASQKENYYQNRKPFQSKSVRCMKHKI